MTTDVTVVEVEAEAEIQIVEVVVPAAIQVVEVEVAGIQGPKGDKGDKGDVIYQIYVGDTAPEDPQVYDIWIDTSST